MKYGRIAHVDKPISRVVQGMVMISDERQDKSSALLDASMEHGITTFDTAYVYGGGSSERGFGNWVADRGVRDRIVLLDKGAHPDAGGNKVNAADITSDITESLDRLGFEHIDIYVLHRDDPEVPVSEIVDVLNEHHAAGRIGAFGGSNWTHERIAAANEYARANGRVPFVAASPQLSLAEMIEPPWADCLSVGGPSGEAERKWFAENGLAVFAWSSLAGGFLSGVFTRENLAGDVGESGLRNAGLVQRCYADEDNFRRLDRLRELAAERGVSVAQAALAYVLSLPLDTYALAAGWEADQIAQNAAAAEIELSAAEIAWLELRSESR